MMRRLALAMVDVALLLAFASIMSAAGILAGLALSLAFT